MSRIDVPPPAALGWDGEFESGFLQRRFRKLSVPADQDLIDQSQKIAATAQGGLWTVRVDRR
jgi:hypothetical protein